MKLVLAFSCLACLSVEGYSAEKKDLPSCSYSKSGKVHLSNMHALDDVEVSVKGAPCWKGELVIQVKNTAKKTIYSYKAEFKPHTAVSWDDPYLPIAASKLVDGIISRSCVVKNTRDLPPWKDPKSYYDEFYYEISVPEQEYIRIKSMNLPVFCHPVSYESDLELIYDPKKKQTVKVRSGGS